jgi:hypothetical protein
MSNIYTESFGAVKEVPVPGGGSAATGKNYTDVETSVIHSVHGSVASAIDGMRGVHSNLSTSVPGGLNPYWDGRAHDIFEAGFAAFLGRLSLYIADCERLNGKMDAARKNYEGAEGVAQSGVGSLTGDIGSVGMPPGTAVNTAPVEVVQDDWGLYLDDWRLYSSDY